MKFKSITIVLLASLLPLFSQSTTPHATKKSSKPATPAAGPLKDFDYAKFWGGQAKLPWALNINLKQQQEEIYTALKNEDIIQNSLFFDEDPGLKSYTKQIKYAITQIGTIDGNISYFIVSKICKPFRLVKYNNKKCMVAYVFTDSVYNTLRFPTKRKLASKLINTGLISAIKSLGESFDNSDISYVSLFFAYGTKDFSDDSVMATKPEVINLTASTVDIKRFMSNAITDSEFINRCTILISDRNSSSDFAKILVDVE